MDINYRKIVYFVRHGQSVDNGLPVFQSINSPLSENGNNQAISIANRLSALQFESLISSPIQRAKETAAYISKKTGKKIEYSGLFVERISLMKLVVNLGTI
jgi:probable phosphoglycerate mutase